MKFLFVALFAMVSRRRQFWSFLRLHDQKKAQGGSGVSGNHGSFSTQCKGGVSHVYENLCMMELLIFCHWGHFFGPNYDIVSVVSFYNVDCKLNGM